MKRKLILGLFTALLFVTLAGCAADPKPAQPEPTCNTCPPTVETPADVQGI